MKIQNQQMISFSTNRYQKNAGAMTKTLEKLSSGIGVNRANDSASGLAISETMKAQIRGLSQAQRNMQDGLSVLEATDEGLQHVAQLLQRGRELSVMSSNDTYNEQDRIAAQQELNEILKGIDDTADKLEFNTQKILGENASLFLMVGANPGQRISINLVDTSSNALGIGKVSLLTREQSEETLVQIDKALNKVSSNLTNMGSKYEAIQHHMNNVKLYEENITTSYSAIRDADMAKETLSYITLEIRQKGDHLLVSQFNNNTKDILDLLK